MHRLAPAKAVATVLCDELGDDLGVGLRREGGATGDQLVLQLGKVLDDAVVHDGNAIDEMRMGIGLGRRAMRRPACVGDADRAGERFFGEALFEIEQLAFGAAAHQLAVDDGGNAGGIIAAVFKALQGIDEAAGNRLVSDDTDNSAHGPLRRFISFYCIRFVEVFRRGATRRHSLSIASVNAGSGYPAAFFLASLIAWLRSRIRTALPSLFSCRARPKATASSGTSSVMTLPDAI
jgi:hypothetical protein